MFYGNVFCVFDKKLIIYSHLNGWPILQLCDLKGESQPLFYMYEGRPVSSPWWTQPAFPKNATSDDVARLLNHKGKNFIPLVMLLSDQRIYGFANNRDKVTIISDPVGLFRLCVTEIKDEEAKVLIFDSCKKLEYPFYCSQYFNYLFITSEKNNYMYLYDSKEKILYEIIFYDKGIDHFIFPIFEEKQLSGAVAVIRLPRKLIIKWCKFNASDMFTETHRFLCSRVPQKQAVIRVIKGGQILNAHGLTFPSWASKFNGGMWHIALSQIFANDDDVNEKKDVKDIAYFDIVLDEDKVVRYTIVQPFQDQVYSLEPFHKSKAVYHCPECSHEAWIVKSRLLAEYAVHIGE